MAVIFRRGRVYRGAEYITGMPGQDEFVLQELEYISGVSELQVYVNGIIAYPDVDYTIIDSRTIKLASSLPEEAELAFFLR